MKERFRIIRTHKTYRRKTYIAKEEKKGKHTVVKKKRVIMLLRTTPLVLRGNLNRTKETI